MGDREQGDGWGIERVASGTGAPGGVRRETREGNEGDGEGAAGPRLDQGRDWVLDAGPGRGKWLEAGWSCWGPFTLSLLPPNSHILSFKKNQMLQENIRGLRRRVWHI